MMCFSGSTCMGAQARRARCAHTQQNGSAAASYNSRLRAACSLARTREGAKEGQHDHDRPVIVQYYTGARHSREAAEVGQSGRELVCRSSSSSFVQLLLSVIPRPRTARRVHGRIHARRAGVRSPPWGERPSC